MWLSVAALLLVAVLFGRQWYEVVGPGGAVAALKSVGIKLCLYGGGYALLLTLYRLGVFRRLLKQEK